MPTLGPEALRFLGRCHPEARLGLERDTVAILGKGAPPGSGNGVAGLIVGYVQSGKTTSFTAAAAAARDNGFAIVIVIAGTSTNLLDQTQERLARDLGLTESSAHRRWIRVRSPRPGTEEARSILAALESRLDEDSFDDDDNPTVLISVMKHHDHLEWLAAVLRDVSSRVDLTGLTALIIDDEADQASPNIKKTDGAESRTYGQIRQVRSTLPTHTFLQYTATPQALLLINLIDELSPEFVYLIDPGEQYTGGKYFFDENRSQFVRTIPAADLEAVDDPGEPPRSLQDAFASFVVGAAAGRLALSEVHQRSMLVHPSRDTLPHEHFMNWLRAMRDNWSEALKLNPDDADRQWLLRNLIEPAYADLASTASSFPDLESLIRRLPAVLRKTKVVEVNAVRGRATPIEWATAYAWVLVGGQLLDRGFTVEGLTVTYMPRGLGVGNADTVQQRARFFGYKLDYADVCRAWLEPEVATVFTKYVLHEEAMRKELAEVAASGRSLKDWKRVFLLDKRMSPTRRNVVRIGTARTSFAGRWFAQREFDGADEALFAHNRLVVRSFVEKRSWKDDPGDARRDALTQVHPYTDAPLEEVRELLLQDYLMCDQDSADFAALRLLLAVADESGHETCRVHWMRKHSRSMRMRSVDSSYRIKNLFQGSNAASGYPGDRRILEEDSVTVQLHTVELRTDDRTDEGAKGTPIGSDVPVLAIRVPDRMDPSVIMQLAN